MHFSRYKRLACVAGLVIAISIALCPHATHGDILGSFCGPGHLEACEETSPSHDDDHQHSELDAAHSHDFLLSRAVSVMHAPQFYAYVDFAELKSRRPGTQSSIPLLLPDLSGSHLKALKPVRLLI
jgi:hypothetical protein